MPLGEEGLVSINSEQPHALINLGNDPVEAVWVNVRGGPQIGHEFGSPRMP